MMHNVPFENRSINMVDNLYLPKDFTQSPQDASYCLCSSGRRR
jgi:hypothetical protein